MPDRNETVAGLLTDLWAIHESMSDLGICPYFRRGEEGQDPAGICSFGCHDEPACMTNHDPEFPWASEMMRDLIARVEQVGYRLVGGRSIYTDPTMRPHEKCMTESVYVISPARGSEQ